MGALWLRRSGWKASQKRMIVKEQVKNIAHRKWEDQPIQEDVSQSFEEDTAFICTPEEMAVRAKAFWD